ncbi:MAG: protein kinase [Candidatus Xenobiia bacterium LiM19]
MELLSPDTTLADRYQIRSVIGCGGMGAVYLARDMRLPDKQWAVKEIWNTYTNQKQREEASTSFSREAEILSRLDHPGIPRIADYFSFRDREYLVMEYAEGRSLQDILEERKEPFSEDEAVDIALQICEVLIYLHNQKPDPVIFRDLKPSNIIVSSQGRVKLVDFGIARFFHRDKVTDTIHMGTVGYAPPEQFGGKGGTDPRSDLYTLGATLHFMITLRDPQDSPPFSFPPVRELNPAISPQMENLVATLLQYDRACRYCSAQEAASALKTYRDTPLQRPKKPEGREFRDIHKPRQRLSVLAALAVLLILIISQIPHHFSKQPPAQKTSGIPTQLNPAPTAEPHPNAALIPGVPPNMKPIEVTVPGRLAEISQLFPDEPFSYEKQYPGVKVGAEIVAGNFTIGRVFNYQSQSTYAHRVLFSFDLSSIPSGSIITSAILSCPIYCIMGDKAPGKLVLYRLTQKWDPLRVTWRATGTGTAWGSEGGHFDLKPAGVHRYKEDVISRRDQISFDLTKTVSQWISGASANEGLILLIEGDTGNIPPNTSLVLEWPILALTVLDNAGGLERTLVYRIRNPRVEGYDTELAKPLTEEELKNPERRKAHLKAGMDYMRCNELDEMKCQNAVRIFEELADKVPETEEGLEALRNLPFCYRRLKKTDKYLEVRRKIINYGTEKSRASDHYDYAEALVETGNCKEALEQYRLASEIASMNMDSNRYFPALCQYKYAGCLETLGKNREAQEAYKSLAEKFPGVELDVAGKRGRQKTETISREALERIPAR